MTPTEIRRDRVRPARFEDGERMREIAALAKGHWGCDHERIKQWADADFSIKLNQQELFAAEVNENLVAWISLIRPIDGVAVLDDLWVDPDWIGVGIGSLLFGVARRRAEELGARLMEWEAEPNAIGFYERMGARYLRDQISEWNRPIKVMGVDMAAD